MTAARVLTGDWIGHHVFGAPPTRARHR
jgi:hypothetical protein